MTKKCICQICSCGRHRCPHNTNNVNRVINKTEIDKCHVSEYGGKFKNTDVARGPFRKPTDLIVAEGKQDHTTVHKSQFVPHTYETVHYKKIDEYIPNLAPMDLDTEYQQKYIGEKAAPATMPRYLRGETNRKFSGKMCSETVQKKDFPAWEVQKCATFRKNENYIPPSQPFTETSIHRSDFINFKQTRPLIAHQPDMIKLEGNLNMETSNKADFPPHKCHPDIVKRVEKYIPNNEPFQGNSLIREDFPNHGIFEKTPIFKPISTVLKSKSPMHYDTTNKCEFKKWKLNQRYQKHKEPYIPPTGSLDLKTTSSDYCTFGPGTKAAPSARPKTKLRTGRDGEFDGTSNYAETYKPWAIQPVRPIRMEEELRRSAPANLKFTETSEHREKYKPHAAAPASMARYKSSLFKTDKHLEDVSQYKNDFKGTTMKDCPSHALLKLGEFSGIKFEEDFDTGHRFVVMKQDQSALPPIASNSNTMSQSEKAILAQ